MVKKTTFLLIIGFIIPLFFTGVDFSFAATQQELQDAINKKNSELQQINSQILETQKQIGATQQTSRTLKQEVTKFDKQISQFNLSIRSSEITIEKLNLEIEALQYDISDTRIKVGSKKEAIDAILRQIQQTSEDTPLTIFLKGNQLADSFFEFQGLKDLNNSLSAGVTELKTFAGQLTSTLQEATNKNQQLQGENKTLKNKKYIAEDLKQGKQSLLQQTKNQEKTYQNQLSDLRKQQGAISDEIANFEEVLSKSFNVSVLPTQRPGVLSWPIKLVQDGGIGRITQNYGETASSYFYKGKPHNGTDIGVPIGTPVYAAADGVVMAADNNDQSSYRKYQYGKYILIKHENNLATFYSHLSMQTVSGGASVKKGDLIGYSGNTGFTTGPHLHFGVYWAPSIIMKSIPPAKGLVPVGVTVNPKDYL